MSPCLVFEFADGERLPYFDAEKDAEVNQALERELRQAIRMRRAAGMPTVGKLIVESNPESIGEILQRDVLPKIEAAHLNKGKS